MRRYLSIYRPINIVFIAIAQWLSAYFLDVSASLSSISDKGLYWLILGTASCAAFGYWINDFLDKERDLINKETPSSIASLDSKLVYIHLLVFISIALYAGNVLGVWFIGLFMVTLLSLFLYSKWLKNFALLGNTVIAALSFVSLFAVSILIPAIDFSLILHFATLAAFITLCRELVKDAEDVDGDSQAGGSTLPVLFGLKTTNMSVYIVILFTLAFTIVSLFAQSIYFKAPLSYVYYCYYGLFVIFPLYQVAIDVRYAKDKGDYKKLSKVLKYILFTGILSILFF